MLLHVILHTIPCVIFLLSSEWRYSLLLKEDHVYKQDIYLKVWCC